MAIYTTVSNEELSDFISLYDIGDVTACVGIAEGVENTNYKLTTTTGKYILTLYERRVDPGELPFYLGLMEHLSQNGISCPEPIQANDGSLFGTLCSRPAAIFTFLPGNWPRDIAPHHCHEVGKWLAKLHLAGGQYTITRANNLSVSNWRSLLEQCDPKAINELAEGIYDQLESEIEYLEAHWPLNLPEGIIHADLFPDNVFFEGDHLSGMIDFYFACQDAFAYDIAICINAWCFDDKNGFMADHSEALLKGYAEIRRPGQMELSALPILTRGAAIRFMLTRLYDWVNTPDEAVVNRKDPTEFIKKLQFHQNIKSAQDYGLEITDD